MHFAERPGTGTHARAQNTHKYVIRKKTDFMNNPILGPLIIRQTGSGAHTDPYSMGSLAFAGVKAAGA
jgi:hypothetical protein